MCVMLGYPILQYFRVSTLVTGHSNPVSSAWCPILLSVCPFNGKIGVVLHGLYQARETVQSMLFSQLFLGFLDRFSRHSAFNSSFQYMSQFALLGER